MVYRDYMMSVYSVMRPLLKTSRLQISCRLTCPYTTLYEDYIMVYKDYIRVI